MVEGIKEEDVLLAPGFSSNKLLAKRTIKQFHSYQTKHPSYFAGFTEYNVQRNFNQP